ncbi:MAG: hypothetical protein O9325_18210, partial [Roseomonas sp.]|nr:hypothetical protein [Roseomonas sp.]
QAPGRRPASGGDGWAWRFLRYQLGPDPAPGQEGGGGYLRMLLDRIADHPINRIGELAPWNLRPDAT